MSDLYANDKRQPNQNNIDSHNILQFEQIINSQFEETLFQKSKIWAFDFKKDNPIVPSLEQNMPNMNMVNEESDIENKENFNLASQNQIFCDIKIKFDEETNEHSLLKNVKFAKSHNSFRANLLKSLPGNEKKLKEMAKERLKESLNKTNTSTLSKNLKPSGVPRFLFHDK